MITDIDLVHLRRALDLAKIGAQAGEVPVGAVLVGSDGQVIAEARNAPIELNDPTAHAEILAIRSACRIVNNYRILNSTLYVSLEPCAMCAGAIANARIKRVVFSAGDIKGGAVINGPRFFELPTCHWHPQIDHGELADESASLLKNFFRVRRKNRSDD